MAEWPSTLPSPRRANTVSPGNRMVETLMLSGRRVVRNWGATPPDIVTVQVTIASADEAVFRYFCDRTGMDGIWFTANWLTALGYTDHKARFHGYPKRKGITGSFSTFSVSLLVQQSDLCNDPPPWVPDVENDWLTGWSYRKKFEVISSGGSTTDYTIPLTLKQWLAWNDHPSNPVLSAGQSWEGVNVYSMCIVTDLYGNPVLESGYMRGFWGGFDGTRDHIGTGISSTGTTWSKFSSNPIFGVGVGSTAQSWNGLHNNDPCVIYDESVGLYKMWYTGDNVSGQDQIGYATAAHPESAWTPYASNPVLTSGYDADEYYVSEPAVLIDGDGTYRMWYTGFNSSLTSASIFYATSTDGITWTRQGEVVADAVSATVKRLDDGILIMAARTSGSALLVIYRSDDDGFTWSLIDWEVVPFVSGVSDYGTITPCLVKYSSSVWLLFYSGVAQADWAHNNICMAYSGDNNDYVGLNFHTNDYTYDNVRFTGPDAETLIPHYIESISGFDASCKLYVKLSSVQLSATEYYLYYNNAEAAAVSSMADTFLFGDDFERDDSSDVGNGWTESNSYISSNKLIVLRSGANESCERVFVTTYSIELVCRMSSSVTNSDSYFIYNSDGNMAGFLFGADGKIYYLGTSNWVSTGIAYSAATMTTFRLIYLAGLNTVTYYVNDTQVASGITPYPTGDDLIAICADNQDHYSTTEYIWLRKYFSVEPEIDTWYEEESR